jgi:hypothetical protein
MTNVVLAIPRRISQDGTAAGLDLLQLVEVIVAVLRVEHDPPTQQAFLALGELSFLAA